MNATAMWIIIVLFALNCGYNFLNAIYRIITKEDEHHSWEIVAISDIVAGVLELALLLWLFLG